MFAYVPRFWAEESKFIYVPPPQCPCSLMFIKIYSSVMFLGWPRNISYVPRPPTYVPRFLAEEHLFVSCSDYLVQNLDCLSRLVNTTLIHDGFECLSPQDYVGTMSGLV
jgi:hypothetical protein